MEKTEIQKYNKQLNCHRTYIEREYDSVENTYVIKFLDIDKEAASHYDNLFGLDATFKRISTK